jgi:queuosine precursor transporter
MTTTTNVTLNDRAHFASPDRSMYPVLVALFVGLLLISNIAAVKLIGLFDLPVIGYLVVDGGAFLFPLVYIVGDILSEVYGLRATRRAILLGFGLAILAAATFWVVQLAPPLDGWENQEAFEAVLGFVPRIVLASIAGFLVGQLLNAWVLVKIKERTKERGLWARLIGSTVVGEFADTLIFCTIAFAGLVTGAQFINYVIVGYLFKTLMEVVLLPVTYPTIAWVKRREPTYGTSVAS